MNTQLNKSPLNKNNNSDEIDPKAFLDPTNNFIYEIYPIITGKDYTFNLDGIPFRFDRFLLITVREELVVQNLFIQIPRLNSQNILEISSMTDLAYKDEDDRFTKEEVKEMDEMTVRLELKQDAIDKFLNPKFPMFRSIKNLFDLRDDVGGSVVLDFYYYNMILIEDPYIEVENEEDED
ncbi:MAG: hypothetical protein H7263_05020 [Candidatus Sericytochromatia bacterium]|nr:hypothetical protein [Candidatus Sericytochromatia bacterium]